MLGRHHKAQRWALQLIPSHRAIVLQPLVAAMLLSLAACFSPEPFRYHRTSEEKQTKKDSAVTVAPTDAPEPELMASFENGRLRAKIRIRGQDDFQRQCQRILLRASDAATLQVPQPNVEGDRVLEVPFARLNHDYQKRAVQQVFPDDGLEERGWRHVVTYDSETLWGIALIFTGRGGNYLVLKREGDSRDAPIHLGEYLYVPRDSLIESLRTSAILSASIAPAIPPPRIKEERESNAYKPQRTNSESSRLWHPDLSFVKRGDEVFAVYRLKRGEALYSSVVVRFTGRVEAAEVNELAKELMRINNIANENMILAGSEILIPLRLIDESLLKERPHLEEKKLPRRDQKLHVILDAGHGGNDPGTIVGDLREAELAYDLMCRIEEGLRERGVVVHTLVSPTNGSVTAANGTNHHRHSYLRSSPMYQLTDSRVALNLRICLVDALYSKLLKQGVPPENILFMSIHLDNLHPAVFGTMVYIPGAKERVPSFSVNGAVYEKHQESRGRSIRFTSEQNGHAESASMYFAQSLISHLRKARVPIHEYEPIRRYVYRRSGKWTPGIIRYSRVPTSVLLEAANLSNVHDVRRISMPTFRQRLAEAVVKTIISLR